MARYTSAYSSFVSRIAEVDCLRQFAAKREKIDPVKLRHEISALCRGSIVLLSAHLEAYIKELGENALTGIHLNAYPRANLVHRFYYHISKDILDELVKTTDPSKVAEKLFEFLQSDLQFWSRSGPFPLALPVDRFNKGFSNPAFDKIRAYFNRFGYQEYKKDLARFLKANYHVTVNMVDHLVDTRNKIAHGDQSATKTPADVRDMIAIIRVYCAATDSVFASWCKTNLCSIR